MYYYKNPVIRGFNPDPSICRVGDDFYIVTSTFEYFPGVPIYHSKNLTEWELIGHCLTTAEQNSLEGCGQSSGIYAPTIRYHEGTFFMTTTNVSSIRNFIVHTKDPKTGWSSPVKVEQGGIDPTLFFDDEGKVYYASTGYDIGHRSCIQMSEIDPFTGEMFTDPKPISYGSGGAYPEGPHIFKKGGYYYLLVAEGGTEYGHTETIHRSKNIYGPYEPAPHNPILAHQKLLGRTQIHCTGHADFVEDQNGNWWAVFLGIRTVSYGLLHNLGRETFLAPVVWNEDGWPVIGNNGTVETDMQGPLPAQPGKRTGGFRDEFCGHTLDLNWTFIRNPAPDCAILGKIPGCVTVQGDESLSTPRVSPGFIGVRQTEYEMSAKTKLVGDLVDGQRAGLCAFYGSNHHYEIYLRRDKDKYFVGVNRRIHDLESEVYLHEIDYVSEIMFEMLGSDREYRFSYRTGETAVIAATGKLAALCTEGVEGTTFTGTFIGLFSQCGAASFDFFEMVNE